MSSDEAFLCQLLQAASAVGLEVIIIGSTAAVLQGAPIMTQDVDILVRDTPRNREKLRRFAQQLGGSLVTPTPLSGSQKIVGVSIPVDVLFEALPGGPSFTSLRSRSVTVSIGEHVATVASLADVIASKERAGRPKDRAQVDTLKNTLAVLRAIHDGKSQ